MENKAAKGGNTILKDTLALFLITLVCGILLGFVYELTKEPIAIAQEQAKLDAYAAVYPGAEFTENEEVTALLASDTYVQALAAAGVEGSAVTEILEAQENGTTVGYVMTSRTTNGFNGEIILSLGLTTEGEVTGVEFITLAETAGLGMNAQKPEFKDQYVGQAEESFAVTKDGGSIDAISGATITSRAITDAVNAGLVLINQCIE